MNFKTNLFLFNALIVTIVIGLATCVLLAHIQAEAVGVATLEQEQAIRTFWQLLRDKGTDFRIADGRLLAGDYVVNGNYELPDKIRGIFGDTATIFMGDTRVSTNVLKQDGSRAVGTRLVGPAYDAIFKANRSYRGEAPILGIPYFTAYDPIRDRTGKTIGVLYVGVKKGAFLTEFGRLKVKVIAVNVIIDVILLGLAFLLLRERSRHYGIVQASEQRYRAIFETTGTATFIMDGDATVSMVNDEFVRLSGYAKEEAEGKLPVQEFIVPEHRDRVLEYHLKRRREPASAPSACECHFLRKDGTIRRIRVHANVIPATGQSVLSFVDINEYQEMQEVLRHQLEFHQTLIDTLPSPIFYKDRGGRYLGHNVAYERFIGLPRHELIGKTVFDIAPRDLAEKYLAMDEALFANPGIQVYESSVLYADGSRHEVLFNKATFPGKDGQVGGIVGVILDLSDQKRAEEALRSSEDRYRAVFEASGSAMVINEADTTISLANSQFAKLCGYRKEEIEGKMSWLNWVVSADRDRMLGYHRQRRVDPASAPANYEFQLVDRTGSVRDIMTSVAMIPGTQTSVQSYLDITGLKQTERLLAGEKAVLELIVKDTPLVEVLDLLCRNLEDQAFGGLCSVLLLDDTGSRLRHAAAPTLPQEYCRAIDGTRVGMNIGSCGTAAFTGEEVMASDIASDPCWAAYRKLPLSFGLRACWSKPILSASREILGTFAVYYQKSRRPDPAELLLMERSTSLASIVIERKRSAEALRQVQLHQRAILDNIPDLVWLKDRDSRFITVNQAFAAAGGLSPEEMIGRTDHDIWPADLAEKYRRDDATVMVSGIQTRVEEILALRSGARHWIETIKTPVYDADGAVIGTTGIARDVMERKKAEEALQESEERFHRIFDQNDDAIILFRLDSLELIDANPAALQLFGYRREEMLAKPLNSLLPAGDLDKLIAQIEANDTSTLQLDRARGMRREGQELAIAIRARILRLREEYVVHCSIRDISDKLRLEEEIRATQAKLIQANKMTSLGMVSSSIAHEINNPNNCISVNASMLTEVWQDAERILSRCHAQEGTFHLRGVPYLQMQQMAPRLFNGIIEGSRRISAIIDNMKDFVREGKRGLDSDLDINKLIQNAASILWHEIHKYTDNFQMDLEDDLLPARGNAQQIEQVIINLLVNALQALPDKQRGVCVLTSADRTAGVVSITVRDEGEGMTGTVLAKLREPFFSTRLDKGGTGLGIYISDSIVKEHRGTLEFISEAGKGTVATVRLPAPPRSGI